MKEGGGVLIVGVQFSNTVRDMLSWATAATLEKYQLLVFFVFKLS